MAGKKYIVKVPTGKTTNDFHFDALQPAFRKYCSKLAQNGGTRIASHQSALELPRELTWAELLNDVIEEYRECLELLEKISSLPTDANGKFLLSRKVYEDYKELSALMNGVGPVAWNGWDETSKIYWKSAVPRIRMLLEEGVITE